MDELKSLALVESMEELNSKTRKMDVGDNRIYGEKVDVLYEKIDLALDDSGLKLSPEQKAIMMTIAKMSSDELRDISIHDFHLAFEHYGIGTLLLDTILLAKAGEDAELWESKRILCNLIARNQSNEQIKHITTFAKFLT